MDTKYCPRCQTDKPHPEFYGNTARDDGLSGYCRPCQSTVNARHALKVRQGIMDLLGGQVCNLCGFDDYRALVIDHREGGGTIHRRDTSPRQVLRHVEANPSEYQVLCYNHNQIKRHERGEWRTAEYSAKIRANPYERVETLVRWARRHDSCQGCGTTERKHASRGYCHRCLMRVRRASKRKA